MNLSPPSPLPMDSSRFHSGGDESLFGWPLSDLVRAMETEEAPRAEPTLCIRCPQGKLRRGGLLPFPEINDVRYDQARMLLSVLLGSTGPHALTPWLLTSRWTLTKVV